MQGIGCRKFLLIIERTILGFDTARMRSLTSISDHAGGLRLVVIVATKTPTR